MYKNRYTLFLIAAALFISSCCKTESKQTAAERTITDGMQRTVTIPAQINRLICSGPGSRRLVTYLEAENRVIAVDDMEKRRPRFKARPYAIAHPQFKKLPLFGEFRGFDNPELILNLSPAPELIFKTYPAFGHDPVELQKKTGIPVITLNYGDLGLHKDDLYKSLKIMGKALKKEKRARDVIAYFEAALKDLKTRTKDIA
ncbi:MAG TPA: iron ABC transporter substrate-binding protein, partial [Spirochaetota bacterium]|nr:iron ABC transporter substrate-binding protein [Spirochaetota bacterium]